ncbi:MAG: FHA domain-containing protein [Anaerolineales bacterium]|nr:MAG: FHA domain-containing protein [Anaerolineales bacterium]
MNLKELETRLQTLIEVDLLNVLPGKKVEDMIVQKLATAIQHNSITMEDGSVISPDVYTLLMHPETSAKWNDQQLLAIILHSVVTVVQEAGFRFTMSPTITISTDEKIPLNDAEIVTSHRIESMADTNATPLETGPLEDSSKMPENAFLIVEGVKVYPLLVPVVNIGRRLDNQLVIDDPRVSRNHAQLRTIKGRFVVFDLNSTGGTFVNGQRTSQSVLYPGDVISLAGVALIFGQDNPPPRPDLKDTSPFQQSAERPTAILKDYYTSKLKKK